MCDVRVRRELHFFGKFKEIEYFTRSITRFLLLLPYHIFLDHGEAPTIPLRHGEA